MSDVAKVPSGYHTVTPCLVIKGAAQALEFYTEAFGAVVEHCMYGPDGKVMHAAIKIGDSTLFFGDECADYGILSPESRGGSTVSIHLYVEDADAVFAKAVEAGATVAMPMMDAFWGDRYGKVTDPFGHAWAIATHQEDLIPDEMAERGRKFMAEMAESRELAGASA